MTPYKNYSQSANWSTRIQKGSFYIAVAALLSASAGCSSNNGSDWEQVQVTEATKGVITTVEENKDGSFEIVDEKVVDNKNASRIIVKRIDGRVDSLTVDQAKLMVQAQDTVAPQHRNTNTHHYHHGGGLGSVIWWGAMGYMMGRSWGSPTQSYFYRPGTAAYQGNSPAAQALRSTAITRTEMRPVKGRSGFFSGSRRSTGA